MLQHNTEMKGKYSLLCESSDVGFLFLLRSIVVGINSLTNNKRGTRDGDIQFIRGVHVEIGSNGGSVSCNGVHAGGAS